MILNDITKWAHVQKKKVVGHGLTLVGLQRECGILVI